MRINHSREYIKIQKAEPKSLAFEKNAKERCADFFLQSCHGGNPELTVCGDVTDTQLYNYTKLRETGSINVDSANIKSVRFFTLPNFGGKSHQLNYNVGSKVFAIDSITKKFLSGSVRSIKIQYRN